MLQMGDPVKKVRFELLVPYFLDTNDTGETVEFKYNLSPLFEQISMQDRKATQRRIWGEKHLFAKCIHEEQNHLWEIQLLHYREKVLPGKADEDGAFELIHLDEDEYVAESTTVLYDEIDYRLYIQRNIYGTSIRAFTELITKMSPAGTLITLKPVYNQNKINTIDRANSFSKAVLVADASELTGESKASSIGKLFSSLKRYDGSIIKIEVSNGRSKKNRLNKGAIVSLIKEAYEYSGTQKLELRTQWTEDSAFETIDFLDDRAAYSFDVSYSRSNPITHERLYSLCKDSVISNR